jgi:hypothetical protein
VGLLPLGILRIPEADNHAENGLLVILGNSRLFHFAEGIAGKARGELDYFREQLSRGFTFATSQGIRVSPAAIERHLNRIRGDKPKDFREKVANIAATFSKVLVLDRNY